MEERRHLDPAQQPDTTGDMDLESFRRNCHHTPILAGIALSFLLLLLGCVLIWPLRARRLMRQVILEGEARINRQERGETC